MRKALTFLLIVLLLCGCSSASKDIGTGPAWDTLQPQGTVALEYATQFSVENYPDGLRLISITDGRRYLLVPEGAEIPSSLPSDIIILQQPLNRVYMVATSAMDPIIASGGLDSIRLSGTKAAGWYIEEARQAMEEEKILFAGKYSAPDYELISREKCNLAIESTMIYHTPEVVEQLGKLGIPVFIERSSYEANPLGRMEWAKLYGIMIGSEETANRVFRETTQKLTPILSQENTGKTVAFFSINPNGSVTVRKSGDYIAKTISLAGGQYVFTDLSDDNGAQSTTTIQMEAFFQAAADADILIYSGTINGRLETIDELLTLSPLMGKFKAVQSGDVWGTEQNLFQSSMGLGNLILDMNAIFTQSGAELTYLHKLN